MTSKTSPLHVHCNNGYTVIKFIPFFCFLLLFLIEGVLRRAVFLIKRSKVINVLLVG